MQAVLRHSTAERCIDMVITFGGNAVIAIQDLFRTSKHLRDIPTTFAYGDSDFFKREHADELVNDGTLVDCKVFTVSNSGHHLYFDNPEETLLNLLSEFFRHELK
jgi:pimeloyl-ACP methyl ester carboxylesterase